MLQDPSQFASHIDEMLKQSLGVGGEDIEEEEEIENVPEAENAEEEADNDEEDEDKSSKDELWMNVAAWDWVFGMSVFVCNYIINDRMLNKSCYTVEWKSELLPLCLCIS